MTKPRHGRPRTAGIDEAILIAARELLTELGYAQVTMDAAAARARTSKAAIYRRFGSKTELMFAAAVHSPHATAPSDTGSLRGDLLALAERIRSDMTAPLAREVAPQVVADIARSRDVARRFRKVFVEGEQAEIASILERAVPRGEVPADIDAITTNRMLGGSLFFSIFVVGETPTDGDLELLVDVLAAGLRSA